VTPWNMTAGITGLPSAHASRRNTPAITYKIQIAEMNHTTIVAIHHPMLTSFVVRFGKGTDYRITSCGFFVIARMIDFHSHK